MGIIGRLLGTDKAITETSNTVNTVFTTISKGVDAAIFTKEEKADFIGKMVEVIQRNFTAADALARRVIAITVVLWYLSMITFIGFLLCIGKTELSKALLNLITTQPPDFVTAIFIIYFGYYGVKSGIKEARKK